MGVFRDIRQPEAQDFFYVLVVWNGSDLVGFSNWKCSHYVAPL